MDLNLKGRTALITGGSRGLGEGIARVLAAEGCNLSLSATDAGRLEELAGEIRAAHGVKVTTYPFDLSTSENRAALAEQAGDCDYLINNAGAIPRGYLDQVSPEAWRLGWELKVYGYIDMTRAILPKMKKRGSGVIVNMVGAASERPDPGYIATCCGNAALVMFTRCLGGESVRDGVRIVAVNPGPIMTDRHKKGAEKVALQEFGDKDRWPELYKRFPIGRAGRVDEVSGVVAFLLSDHSSYISGETIRIDAGLIHRDPVY
jgi:hypothetical protein